jgi:adenylate cyclase
MPKKSNVIYLFNNRDSAIYDNLESFRLRQVLGRSVDKKVMERILKDPKLELLKPERCFATVLFADMRNSTQLAENTDTNMLGQYINEFLGEMAQIVISFQGTLDKFIGDEIMALFNGNAV